MIAQRTSHFTAQSDADEGKSTIETNGPATVLASETLVSGEVVCENEFLIVNNSCTINLVMVTATYNNRVICAQHAIGNGGRLV